MLSEQFHNPQKTQLFMDIWTVITFTSDLILVHRLFKKYSCLSR